MSRVVPETGGASAGAELPVARDESFRDARIRRTAEALVEVARGLHARGWLLGTSGNLSAVVERSPLRVAITPTGADKGRLDPARVLTVDALGRVVSGEGRPSGETALHLAIVAERDAGAVLHTHSVWATLLSEACAPAGGLPLAGLEMLKGLAGVEGHEHREWLPIVENSQDYPLLAGRLAETLAAHPGAHGVLLRGHGLYAWGRDLEEARRHVEVLEFLLEVAGRRWQAGFAPEPAAPPPRAAKRR